jgi:structural maintenance of chromosome 1
LEAIVVNTEQTSFECIQYLRENKIRAQLFLPLDTLVVQVDVGVGVSGLRSLTWVSPFISQDVDDRLASIVGKAGSGLRFVRDVIRYEPELEKAVYYAAESTVLCETLAAAKDLRFGREVFVKAVTLDGTVIAKNGNMTGGSSSADADLVRVSRWDEREAREAIARRDALLAEEEALRRRSKRGHGADSSSLHVLIEDLETALKNNAAVGQEARGCLA